MATDFQNARQTTETGKNTSPSRNSEQKIVVLQLFADAQTKARTFKFDKDRIVLGSVISADLRLTGDGISPIHAVLERTKNPQDASRGWSATLYDLASDSGVFVNEKKVITHTLQDQEQITIGRYQMQFSMEVIEKTDRIRRSEGKALFLNPEEDFTPLLLEDERDVVEIFDYRPSSKQALEVVMSWCGMILTIEHFVSAKQVTLGQTKKSDFAIPPLLGANQYPIVVQKQGSFVLNLDTRMKGVIQKAGKLLTLDEIREQTMQGPHGCEVPIGNQEFSKISIGDIDFYFSFTAAPPRLKRRKIFERDPFFVKMFWISMAFTSALIYALLGMEVRKNIEPEQVPDRIANILYQPEKFMKPPEIPTPKPTPKPKPTQPVATPKPPEPPKPPKPKETPLIKMTPKPVDQHKEPPKEMNVHKSPEMKKPQEPPKTPAKPAQQPKPHPAPHAASGSEAKEGEGARAKGAEGRRGDPHATRRSSTPVKEISRPSPHAGAKGASGDSQVSDEGNVDLLKGASGRIQNILGNSAAHLGEGSHNLEGFGNFSTHGAGGLALSGKGEGGGGDANTTLGGLGKHGRGMGRIGTGHGAAGNGNGIVGSRVRVAIRAEAPEESVVMGAIDRDAVAEAIYAHKDEFRLCYEREINAEHPGMSGEVVTRFVIGSSGRVTQGAIDSSSLHNAATESCIIAVLKRIDFPMPKGGGIVEVQFPFKFNAIGK